jgi:hypothetical protein
MSLDLTPVHRNLHTKVTFLGLEFEDLILVLALAALMNLLAHFCERQRTCVRDAAQRLYGVRRAGAGGAVSHPVQVRQAAWVSHRPWSVRFLLQRRGARLSEILS